MSIDYWDLLPLELKLLILKWHKNVRDKYILKLQRAWKRYDGYHTVAQELVVDLPLITYHTVAQELVVYLPLITYCIGFDFKKSNTIKVLKYLNKKLTGNRETEFWSIMISIFYFNLCKLSVLYYIFLFRLQLF